MALPAWRKWRDANPDCRAFVLAKKSVAGIWRFVRDLDGIVELAPGKDAMRAAIGQIRSLDCDEAILLPHSFRSAWVVWRGRARRRRGTTGQFRFPFITDAVSIADLADAHQQFEYARLLGVDGALPSPSEAIDASRLPAYGNSEEIAKSLVVLPGAARGGSKRWPAEYFAKVAVSALADGLVSHVLVCGTPGEAKECADVVAAVASECGNDSVTDLCGKTKLGELAYVLSRCRAACSNDSGGMHLATSMGAPVVAIFGITDPRKTGPLGRSAIVAAEGVAASRAVPRESEEATRALRSVKPERVYGELRRLLSDA